ncbi:unnamed protein product [Microthlaspi erraticum]|uniref:LisH domain-containing protein n=1 Tax=Microthlaspi erraticum TaxID=1685480 RepID=A0A6D2IPS7_9BRAS|nr:unnamed protein product [Microthlaspi erraticum]
MDVNGTVKDVFDRVAKKQKQYHSVSQFVTDRVCEEITVTLIQILLNNDGAEPGSMFTDLRHKLESLLRIIQLQGTEKEMNTSLTKFEKLLEKSYHPDISRACRSIDFDINAINKMIVHYLYRQGMFEIGDCLVKEAEVELEREVRSQYLELHRLNESMKHKDIEPWMRWLSANSEKLKQNGPKLEMRLLSLKFCELRREGKLSEALAYAKTHFREYGSQQMVVVSRLVTSLLWADENLEKSPYKELFSSIDWDTITEEMTKEYYSLLDQPCKSPLAVALSAGFKSLPTLLKLVRVMGLKREEWEAMKQIPVAVELGDEFQFHSIFVCPVNRDVSSEENPPMMMPCRHVICKESIMRLSKNASRRFKCPYCPAQTSAALCRQLYF